MTHAFTQKYSKEEYEDYGDCRQDLITMQETGKGELLSVLARYIESNAEEGFVPTLNAGLDFIRDCIRFAEEHIEFDVCGIDSVFIDPYITETEEEDEE